MSASQDCRPGMSAPANRPEDAESRSYYWEAVQDSKDADGVSWWQSLPELSLGLLDATGVSTGDPIIDVGAGWSTLVDHLVESGYRRLTAIDLSATRAATVRGRIEDTGKHVVLDVADVLDFHPGDASPCGATAPCSTCSPNSTTTGRYSSVPCNRPATS